MAEPSGAQWVPRFAGSTSTSDLLTDFRDVVRAFISQIQDGGATVAIGATYRPPERAYLMHWCWLIAREHHDPAMVPGMPGVNIAWLHRTATGVPDIAASRNAAAAMVAGYAIDYEPSLTSRHTQRRAIDMTIAWHGTLPIIDFNGQSHRITSSPRNGSNTDLVAVGATFGVIKLLSDPPHWSDDGR